MYDKFYVFAGAVALIASFAHSDTVQEFDNFEEWQDAVGAFETIDFTGSGHGDYIGVDYVDSHGVTFTNAFYWNTTTFVNDDWGFRNNAFVLDGVWVDFDEPQMWIATDHAGFISFDLYNEDELVDEGNLLGTSGMGHFSGVVSAQPFDRVFLHRQHISDTVWVDDLHFGTIAPAPGALGVFVLAALCGRSRRRTVRTAS